VVVLVALLVDASDGIARFDAPRSPSHVRTSELYNQLFDCLGVQLHRLVPGRAEVSTNWDKATVLRTVIAADTDITDVRTGHLALLQVRSNAPGSCQGYRVKAVSPNGDLRLAAEFVVARPNGAVGRPGQVTR
jgi:hypothetical protein